MGNNSTSISTIIDNFENACRAKGLRITHQRIEIFKVLLKHTNHPTTEEVFEQVRKHLNTISLDTVYRTIATFETYGLIKRVHHIDNASRFDVNLSKHHHMVCSRCNRIEDFYWPDFDALKPPKGIAGWGKMGLKRVVIDGLCSACGDMDEQK